MDQPRKELKVSALANGTVIDHIPANRVFQVIKILGLDKCEEQILFGTNLDSKKYGKKGIVKVSNLYFQSDDVNKIALVAPTATLIEIRDYQVVDKSHVEIPDQISHFTKCVNPKCVTNHEAITTRFNVVDKEDIKLQCHYCEKVTDRGSMVFI
jgi:aspartate carbamoyltransferase regulatory subunit